MNSLTCGKSKYLSLNNIYQLYGLMVVNSKTVNRTK